MEAPIVYVEDMAQLGKDDLVQMNEDYFKSLNQERLVEVAKNLHQLAMDLWEKQQQNSENSSQPPSKNNPYVSLASKEEKSPNSEEESETTHTEQSENIRPPKIRKKARKTARGKGIWSKAALKNGGYCDALSPSIDISNN